MLTAKLFLRLISFGQQIWLPRAILVSDWLMLSKSSPLKLLGQIKPNLVGSIYVRSSCFLPSVVPFGQAVSEEKICLTLANQKQELLLAAIFVGQMERNEETLCQEQFLFLIG
jgi:hypothetical protein